MINKILYEDNEKSIILSNDKLSNLKLEALVIPAFPDLCLQYSHEYTTEILLQQGECDIQGLGRLLAEKYSSLHGSINKHGLSFLVPPKSAHLVKDYSGDLASNLIYVASIDLDNDGNPICNEEIIRDSTKAVLEKADLNGFNTIGIPAIGKSNFYSNPLEVRVNLIASESYEYLRNNQSNLDKIYILIPDRDNRVAIKFMHPAKLN